jgi:hypothetical protein
MGDNASGTNVKCIVNSITNEQFHPMPSIQTDGCPCLIGSSPLQSELVDTFVAEPRKQGCQPSAVANTVGSNLRCLSQSERWPSATTATDS